METFPDSQRITKPRRTRAPKPNFRRQSYKELNSHLAMQSTHYHRYLAPDSVVGSSYYHQPGSINAQLPLGVPVRPAIGLAIPIQVSGNMLGARARAAEYNAAKAASARQQASEEAEGQQKIPNLPPTPLSAFARNPSASRNKGVKVFKPLILTEEEGNINSVEQENEEPDSPSPESTEPPRSASLPPLHTVPSARSEITHSVQTPHRFRDGPYIPFAPRAMLSDEGYFFGQPIPLPRWQQLMHYQTPFTPLPQTPQILSAPHVGWYPSGRHEAEGPHSGSDGALVPPSTPVPQERPQSSRERESEESATTDTEHAKTQSSQTSPSMSKQGLSLGGPSQYMYGPDDLSPAKCEVKQRAREEAFREQAEASAKAKEESTKETRLVEPPRGPRAEEELLRIFRGTSAVTPQKALSHDQDLSTTQKLSGSVEARPKPARISSETLVPAEADWPYLKRGGTYYRGNNNVHGAENKASAGLKADDASERIKHILLEGLKQRAEADAAAASHEPPPSLPRSRPQKPRLVDARAEQITNLKFPLVDLDSREWLDIRPLTDQNRKHMRRVYDMLNTCSISDKYRDTWEERGGLPRPEFQRQLENSKQEFLGRKKQIDKLADEMQRKWEYGGSFRAPTMRAEEANKHAGTVKAVGGMMSALNIQLEDTTGGHHRGSRPYTVAPDYAIRRSVGLDRQGKVNSLFESSEGADRIVPLRLARDPRFRPQLGEAIKLDEARIPRMFVSKRI